MAASRVNRRQYLRNLAAQFALLMLAAVSLQSTLQCQPEVSGHVALRVIVVGSEAEAQEILDRLHNGEDFGVLAKSKSIDPKAEDYGYLGKVDVTQLRPELREALRGVAPNQVTRPVKVPGGFAILKVLPASEGSVGQGMSPNLDLPLAARGSIRYPADVAGQVIADLAFQKYPKPSGWEQNLAAVCEARTQSLSALECTAEQAAVWRHATHPNTRRPDTDSLRVGANRGLSRKDGQGGCRVGSGLSACSSKSTGWSGAVRSRSGGCVSAQIGNGERRISRSWRQVHFSADAGP